MHARIQYQKWHNSVFHKPKVSIIPIVQSNPANNFYELIMIPTLKGTMRT